MSAEVNSSRQCENFLQNCQWWVVCAFRSFKWGPSLEKTQFILIKDSLGKHNSRSFHMTNSEVVFSRAHMPRVNEEMPWHTHAYKHTLLDIRMRTLECQPGTNFHSKYATIVLNSHYVTINFAGALTPLTVFSVTNKKQRTGNPVAPDFAKPELGLSSRDCFSSVSQAAVGTVYHRRGSASVLEALYPPTCVFSHHTQTAATWGGCCVALGCSCSNFKNWFITSSHQTPTHILELRKRFSW